MKNNPSANTGIPIVEVSEETKNIKIFNDIDTVPWAASAIEALYKKGVINGKEFSMFYPNDNVTREEFTKMLMTEFEVSLVGEELPFVDVLENDWYYPYVLSAYAMNAVNGISKDVFGVGINITRQDLCVMAYRMLQECGVELEQGSGYEFKDKDEISDYAQEAIDYLVKAEIVSGDELGCFNPEDYATRAEAAKILYELDSKIKWDGDK